MPWYLAGDYISLIGGALMITVQLDTSTSKISRYKALLDTGASIYLHSADGLYQDSKLELRFIYSRIAVGTSRRTRRIGKFHSRQGARV